MALVKCRECGTEISTSAITCPKCGSPNPTKKVAAWRVVALLIALALGAWWIFGGGAINNAGTSALMDQVNAKVANDAVNQYNIAKQQGDKTQVCVQAGMVAAAYLQAKDQDNYNSWKATEASDCAVAGLPAP